MSYLNSPLLWGILGGIGVAVPVIIHLLHQRHRRRTDWAAMELLRRALVVRSGGYHVARLQGDHLPSNANILR